MEIKIVEQRPNPLLKRTEYRFEVGHSAQSTPKRDEIRAELAKDLHVPKDRVIVERMRSKFGTPKTVGEALVYTSTDDAKAIEREHVLVRNKLIEKQTPEAAPAAAAAPAPEKAEAASAEKPASAPAEKPSEAPAGKPAAKSSDKPAPAASEKPAHKTAAEKPKAA